MKTAKLPGHDFDRLSVPSDLLDLSLWPRVDYTLMDEKKQNVYLKRAKAVSLFFEKRALSLRIIAVEAGVDRSEIPRMAAECLKMHNDGRIYGFRALVPYYHLSPYTRTKQAASNTEKKAGDAGEFDRLLRRYPELKKYLLKEAALRTKPIRRSGKTSMARHVNRSPESIQAGFLALCRSLGVTENQYPFTKDYRAVRTIYKFVKLNSSTGKGKEKATEEPAQDEQTAIEKKIASTKLLDRVQVDGHKIDLRITISVMDPFGMERLIEIERIWILAIVDVVTRAALGYCLVVSKEYSAADVIEAVCNSLRPKPKRNLIIPELKYPENGGFPNQLFPELCYATWKLLMLDNAQAHLARSTISVLVRTVGCWAAYGPKGEPVVRGIVERFFDLFTTHFAHRLPGTTGSSPADIVRQLGDPGNDLSVLIRLEELEDLVDVLIAEYNANVEDGVGGRTPLEAVSYLLKVKRQRLIHIPPSQRNDLDLLPEGEEVVIRATTKKGGRAYVNFHDVRYFCATLDHKPNLIGTTVLVRYRQKDIRRLRGFFLDGTEIGIFIAASPWSITPHSLALRKEIKKLVRLGKLMIRPGEEPVRCYLEYKKSQMRDSKRSATKYAAVTREQKRAEQDTTAPSVPAAVTPQLSADLTTPEQVDDFSAASPDDGAESPKVKRLSIKKTLIFR